MGLNVVVKRNQLQLQSEYVYIDDLTASQMPFSKIEFKYRDFHEIDVKTDPSSGAASTITSAKAKPM